MSDPFEVVGEVVYDGATDTLAPTVEIPLPDGTTATEVVSANNVRVLFTELRRANNQRETSRQLLESAIKRENDFRTQVRDVAIRVADEQSWCDSGLNDVLEELGLDKKVTEYEVTVRVQAYQTVTIMVEAVDVDEAREQVENGDHNDEVENALEGYSWEDYEYEVEDVQNA